VNGESETGVTTMLLDEGMDTGPILLRRSTPIGPEETAGRLEERLAGMGASLLLETLDGLDRGGLSPIAQDSARATYAPLLKKEDGRVDWGADAGSIERRIRGFQPWPGAAAEIGGRDLKLLKARVLTGGTAEAGTVLAVDDDGIVVACGAQSALRLLEVQPESRHAMSAFAFATGARIRPGQRFS
jgi:methionyl-tRNA formyltransferase